MAKEEKLSFSFSSRKRSSTTSSLSQSKPPPNRPQPFTDDDHPTAAAAAAQFVTVFDPSQALPSSAAFSNVVIAPIPNSDFRKKLKSLLPNQEDSQQNPNPCSETTTRFVLDSNSSQGTDGISYGLTLRSTTKLDAAAPPSSEETPELPRREDLTLRRFRHDMETLPEDRGMDEFAEVSVEDFGAAVLAGYGWKKGQGIGRKNKEVDTKIVEYDRRAGTLGLGYNPSASDAIVRVKKGRDVSYAVNKAAAAAQMVVRVVSGRYVGMKGEVLKRRKEEGSSGVVLKLVNDGREVRLEENMVAELGSEAEDKCLRKLKERESSSRKKGKEGSIEEDGRRGRDLDRRRRRGSRERSPVRWLERHIRVRVISKDFKGGKWYLKKGEVVDVVGGRMCDLMMDDSRDLVRVDQDILETALPRQGGSVLVLYGKHKGVYGSLMEKDTEKETGVVRDADNHELVNVKLEQIAEYVGDPSDLGY